MRLCRVFLLPLVAAAVACGASNPAGPTDGGSFITAENSNAAAPVNVNGVIAGLVVNGTDFEMTVDGRLVRGDADTEFFGGSTFGDLADGRIAVVKGVQAADHVYARRLHVDLEEEDEEDDQDESASIEGILESIEGTGDALTLVVDGTTVLTTADTRVRRRGDVQDLTVLQPGMLLHVVGTRQPDGSIVARMLQIKGDAPDGAFQIQGSMGGVKGTCPTLTFVVNGFRIATDESTTFTPECSTLKSGTKVIVDGVVGSDGSVTATSVTKP